MHCNCSLRAFESNMMAPYIIMTGVRYGTLFRRSTNLDGPRKITFHPKPWMNKEGCCLYLHWLRSCYPSEKLGLIWDVHEATSHFSEHVVNKAASLGITLGAIPPGCTSLIQICDLIVNKPLKQAFKKIYVSWMIRSDHGPGQKYKVERNDVIQWLEEAIEEVHRNLTLDSRISKAFLSYRQDHRPTIKPPSCSIIANTKNAGFISRCYRISNVYTLYHQDLYLEFCIQQFCTVFNTIEVLLTVL